MLGNLSLYWKYNVSQNTKRIIGILFLLLLVGSIPLTLFTLSQTQDIRQQAQEVAPTPNPFVCDDLEHHIERSILVDSDLDGPYSNGVPEGWTGFSQGNVTLSEETGYEKFGRASLFINGSGDFVAGIYQTVNNLTPGQWYHAFYGTAQQGWGPNGVKDGAPPTLREVGIDLTGGTDPYSSNVIWGRPAGGIPDQQIRLFGTWHFLGTNNNPLVSFQATSPTATMFIKVSGFPDITRSETWVDSAFLAQACEIGNFTQPNPGSENPTSTPTPTLHLNPNLSECRQVPNNLALNCDFESAVDFNNPTGPDWRDTAIDPERQAGTGQYTRDNSIVATDNGKSLQIGRESNTCSLPRTAGGGNPKLFRIFSDTRQNIYVGNSQNFTLSFDLKMKSSHTFNGGDYKAAPFYIWSGFIPQYQSLGKEIFLAFTPHDEQGDGYCSQPIRDDYRCWIGFTNTQQTNCDGINNSWKRFTINYTRQELCEQNGTSNPECVTNADKLFIGFGVTNDYDTQVQIDNVVFTADRVSSPSTPPTESPTTNPTLPPTQEGTTDVLISAKLQGIGPGGNPNPKTQPPLYKLFEMQLFDEQGRLAKTMEGVFDNFNRTNGVYSDTLTVGGPQDPLPNGDYTMKIKVAGFLRKTLEGFRTLNPNTTTEFPLVSLIAGDVNNDNVINILDWNILVNCLSQTTNSCLTSSDLNDDSVVNILDWNLIRENFNKREGN